MKRKIKKRSGECVNCSNNKSKKDFIKKTVSGNAVYVCKQCGYYNGESIFIDYADVSNEKLIFGQPLKGKK